MAVRFFTARALVLVASGVFLAGCGSQTASGESPDGQAQPSGGCPLTPEALSKATSLSWELQERKDDHPLETAESIKVTACLYAAADAPQDGSDPLVLRADVATGADAATIRKDFIDTCTEYGGKVGDSAAADGAIVCDRNGSTVEGLVGGADRVVNVYLVNAEAATAGRLTPAFDRILAAVG
ncbi:hypothetical protein [Streptosporangium sp. NPDC001681]|uniref:hypothetical protein n=1 Tax=Streptosporangium sp. NPDC001681 TaxID=3154395 RepID=UPI00332F1B6C